jgi:SAM-dependent methyltransferase
MNHGHPDAAAQYVQRTLAGAEYVRHITSSESDRRARSAFQDLVLRIAPPGAALFDFGAGPGIDARFFAERGFTIEAYDVDPRMREFFAEYCSDLLDSGRVVLDCRSYREFVTYRSAGTGRRADLVVSNFAPLNLVDDPRELFAKFHALTTANGKVLASVLNPCFSGEMQLGWWWLRLLRLWRHGFFFLPGPQAPHYRRRIANFAELSSPCFRLTRVYRGLAPDPQDGPNGIDPGQGSRHAWLHVLRCRYMFLLFEKRAQCTHPAKA